MGKNRDSIWTDPFEGLRRGGGGHIPILVFANHSLKEKAEGFYF